MKNPFQKSKYQDIFEPIRNLQKKTKYFLLVVVGLLIAGVTFIVFGDGFITQVVKFPGPQKLAYPSFYSSTSINFSGNPDLSGLKSPKTLPSKAPIYQLNFTPMNENRAKNLASKFNLAENPKAGTDAIFSPHYFWQGGEKFVFSLNQSSLNYLDMSPPFPSFSPGKSSFEYYQEAQNILQEKNLWYPGLTSRLDLLKFYIISGMDLEEVEDLSQAQLVRLDFDFTVDDISVRVSDPEDPFIVVFLKADGSLAKLLYRFQPQLTSPEDYPTISFQEAKRLLSKKELGTAVKFSPKQKDYFPSSVDLNSVKLDTLSLAYFLSFGPEADLFPVYLVRGQATTKKEEVGDIFYYLPATPQ